MTVRRKRPSIRHAAPPGAQVRPPHVAPETPIDPSGKPTDAPPTFAELLQFKADAKKQIAEYTAFLRDIYDVLDGAKGNQDRIAAITQVKKAIASLDEVETA